MPDTANRHGRFQFQSNRFGYLAVTPVDGVADQLDRGEPLLTLEEAQKRLETLDDAYGRRIVVVSETVSWGDV